MTAWLHGTDQRFDAWTFPPPASPTKPELLVHTAHYFTNDPDYARHTGPNVCAVSVAPGARVLDVTTGSAASHRLRQRLRNGRVGRLHLATRSPRLWDASWANGTAMRIQSDDPQLVAEANEMMRLARMRMDGIVSPKTTAAWISVQNLTREWIEEISVAARVLGYDALVGREVDSESGSTPRACGVLFALTDKAVSDPEWLT